MTNYDKVLHPDKYSYSRINSILRNLTNEFQIVGGEQNVLFCENDEQYDYPLPKDRQVFITLEDMGKVKYDKIIKKSIINGY